jgi:hypothetical protein
MTQATQPQNPQGQQQHSANQQRSAAPQGQQQTKTPEQNAANTVNRIKKVANLAMTVWVVLVNVISQIFQFFGYIIKVTLTHFVELLMTAMKSLDMRFYIAFWVGVAAVTIACTASGWWYMGWTITPKLASLANIRTSRLFVALIFLAIGLGLNMLQMKASIWQIKNSVAKAWHEADGAKADMATAANKPKSFLVAKMKTESLQCIGLEFLVQIIYHVLMGTSFVAAFPVILLMLFAPVKVVIRCAHELQAIEHKLV